MNHRRPCFSDAADNGWESRGRKTSDMELDITPMIDVTFLLLIFFMVTSTMQAPDLEIPPAEHGEGIDTRAATIILVKGAAASATGLPEMALENGNTATLDDVRAEIELGLGQDRSHVIIKADGSVPHGFVQEVIRTVTSVEGTTFSIGVRDKRNQ